MTKKVNGTKVIADHFNSFFQQIGTNMASKIPKVNEYKFKAYFTNNTNTHFKFKLIDKHYVTHIIKKLNCKTSFGYDGLSTKLLKQLEPILSGPISLIVNQSLKTGIFPDKLKLAKITPIFKKGNKHICENYRPISVLPAISKIFEKVVHDQIYSYFTQHNYFSNNQYGFRKYHSTEHTVLEVIDRATSELDSGNSAVAIFIDLSKAFDTLNHNILIEKLHYYGINNLELSWFSSYLSNRSQYVEIDHVKSNYSFSSIGIPQGSILGPLLFNIYVNDLQNSTKYFKFIMYADDTTLYSRNFPANDTINREFHKVFNWFCVNKLSLNIDKTKFMIFHNRNKNITQLIPEISINDHTISRVTKFNFLGIVIDENLNWNSHLDKICFKISRAIGTLHRLKCTLPSHILKILYNSLILPHCTYGILSWGSNVDKVLKLQKKAVRIITKSAYNSHSDPLFKTLGLLKIHDIYKCNVLKYFYQHCHYQLRFFLQNIDFKPRSDIHEYNTRQKKNLCTN